MFMYEATGLEHLADSQFTIRPGSCEKMSYSMMHSLTPLCKMKHVF